MKIIKNNSQKSSEKSSEKSGCQSSIIQSSRGREGVGALMTLSVVAPMLMPLQAHSAGFELFDGNTTGTLDTTVSYGATFRTESRDPAQASTGDPTTLTRRSQVNENDGNNNFDTGLVSSVVKITSELEMVHDNVGLFVRGTAFYDEVIMHGHHDGGVGSELYENNGYGNDFGDTVKDKVGSRAEILDAYVWGDWMIKDRPLNVRLGNQVVSWGEALFLQDGVNQINPASLATLRLPGAEIKEALIPLPMAFVQFGITDNLTLETYYQFAWEHSEADPAGTFLSSDDALAAEGGNTVLVNVTGSTGGLASVYNEYQRGNLNDDVLQSQITVTRAPTDEPEDDGQYGVALRYFSQALNDTEFAFYYLNYHSHKPTAGAILGPSNATSIEGSAACLAAQETLLESGVSATCGQMDAFASGAFGPALASVVGTYNAISMADNAQYFRVYEEDNRLYGFSFNTSIGKTSFAGELAYRKDAPFLPEDGDNLIGHLLLSTTALNADGTFGGVANGGTSDMGSFVQGIEATTPYMVSEHKDMFNLSLVAIHSFGPRFGANQVLGLFEAGLAYVGGLDDDLLYTAEGVDLYIPAELMTNPFLTPEEKAGLEIGMDGAPGDFLDSTSWGYRLVTRLEYNNVFSGVNLQPTLKFAHDVEGNSVRGGNFMENRKSATLALNGSYMFNLEFGISYTGFWGAGLRNYLSDRDHASLNVKYSF